MRGGERAPLSDELSSGSGGGYEVRGRGRFGASKSTGALLVAALQFEVDCTDFRMERCLGGGALLGRTAPVIGEVRFHNRHPPMARSAKRPDASRSNRIIHISLVAVLTDSLRSTY